MFRFISSSGWICRLGRRLCCVAAVVTSLGLSGCCGLGNSGYDFSGADGLRNAPPADWSRELPPVHGRSVPHAITNQGMEIEKNFGIRQ